MSNLDEIRHTLAQYQSAIKRNPSSNYGPLAVYLRDVPRLLDALAKTEACVPTHIYCPQCGEMQPIRMEGPRGHTDGGGPWGDLVCNGCSLVVATVEYRFAADGRKALGGGGE